MPCTVQFVRCDGSDHWQISDISCTARSFQVAASALRSCGLVVRRLSACFCEGMALSGPPSFGPAGVWCWLILLDRMEVLDACEALQRGADRCEVAGGGEASGAGLDDPAVV